MAAVEPDAFASWQTVQEEFLENGITPEDYLGELSFIGGDLQDVVYAVRDGRADTGVVRSGTLEQMNASGLIDINAFQVVNGRTVPGYPFLLSTDLYPEWVFAESPGAPDGLRHLITRTLLSVGPDSRAATEGGYAGWQNALDYTSVHLVLQSLRAAPYENVWDQTLWQVLEENKYWLIAIGIVLSGLLFTPSFATRRSMQLSRARGEIVKFQASELAFQEAAIDEHAIVNFSDAEGIITYVNDNFVEITGYSAEELIGKRLGILDSQAHDPVFFEQLWRTVRSGKTWSGEIRNRRKDGSFYWVHSTIVPHLGENGEIREFIELHTDITEARANKANQQLNEVLELIQDEIYMFWPDSLKICFANASALAANQRSREELEKATPLDLASGLDEAKFRKSLQTLVNGERDKLYYEGPRPTLYGVMVPSEVTIQYVCPDGLKPRFLMTMLDISARAAALDEVVQLKATLDNIDDEVYMFWPETRNFFYVNKAAKARTGLSEQELFQMTPSDLAFGPNADECQSLLRPLIDGEKSRQVLRREVLDLDGNTRTIEFDIKYVKPENNRPRFHATVRDVTGHAVALEDARQLRSSLELTQSEVYIFRPGNYEYLYMNRLAAQRTKWSADEWRGMHTWEALSPKQQDRLDEKCRALIAGPEKSKRYQITDRNGTPLEVSLQLIEPVGEKPHFLSIYRDISEQKQADTAKAEFISTISHELRTPLTSIKGSLGLIKAGAGASDPKKFARMIDIAYSNTERLAALVNDILDWDKIESDKMTFQMEDADLSKIARAAVEENRGYAREHGVRFIFTGADEPLMCRADHGRIMQVMANLLSNAAKFSSRGASVEVSAEAGDGSLRVWVRDSGIGIPAAAQATIFERFTQVDSSDVRRKGGTGLGLSITRSIIEAHNGTIDLVSREGEGTTFFFDLPMLAGESEKKDPPRGAAKGKANKRGDRILICERDPDTAMQLWLALERMDRRASVAATATQARRMIATGDFDGMTIDVGMFKQGDPRLLLDFRADPTIENLPVVIVSATSENDTETLAGGAVGLVDWLQEPLEPEELFARLRRAVRVSCSGPAHILHVEDDPGMQGIVARVVGENVKITCASSVAAARAHLSATQFELAILNLSRFKGSGTELLALLNRSPQRVTPLIAFSKQGFYDGVAQRIADALLASPVSGPDLILSIDRALHLGRQQAANNRKATYDA
jgi:PAS domain S-box-containing protein